MKSTVIAVTCALALGAGVTGCKSTQGQVAQQVATVKTETLKQTQAAISKVLYGEWTAVDVNGSAVTGDDRPYVIFDKSADNPYVVAAYANNGCNTLNGQFAVTPGGEMKIIGDFASTMRMCDNAQYEMGFNMALNYVTNYKLEQVGAEYLLYMMNAEGKNLMVLRKADAGFMNGAWQVTKIGQQEIGEEKGLEMVVDIPDMKVHGNAGCNVMNGTLFIDAAKQNSLQFRDLRTTRMTCPDIALEQQFMVALEQVETAVPGKSEGTAMLKDASGKVLITLKRIDITQ